MADNWAASSSFTAIRNVVWSGSNFIKMTAGKAITAGMVVAYNTTGVDMTVEPCTAGVTGMPIGVAVITAAAGAEVTIATTGCVCYVTLGDDGTGIDAGDLVTVSSAYGGVELLVMTGTGSGGTDEYQVGIALDDFTAGANSGRILVMPAVTFKPA